MKHRNDEPQPPQRCDSCGATDEPLESATLGGMQVWMCVNPVACRLRAQKAGIWCVYSVPVIR